MSAPLPSQNPASPPQGEAADGETAVETMVRVQQEVEQALESGSEEDVQALIEPLHSADIADLLEQLSHDNRELLIAILRPQLPQEPEFLSYLDEDVREAVLEVLHPHEVAGALAEMESDDALELIEDLDPDERVKILESLPASDRRILEEGLTFPEDSAGRLMQREVVAVPMFWTVGKTIDYLRTTDDLPSDFFLIFATDPGHHPVGAAPLSRILRSKRSVKIGELLDEEIRQIPVDMDQEEVAYLFHQYGLVSAPVVDEDGRLVGVITVDDVVHVIHEEAEEDLLALGGVQEDDLYRDILDTSRSRFSWLGINLITAILASAVIALFEGTIERLVALAILMPIVASMGGNAGTQALTVAVRAIALRNVTDKTALRLLSKEVAVGTINGLLFAVVAGLAAWFWFSDPLLGGVIGVAMVVNLVVGGFAGALIPLTLERFGVDPAIASGVILTTVTDVVGFFVFLGLAAIFLL